MSHPTRPPSLQAANTFNRLTDFSLLHAQSSTRCATSDLLLDVLLLIRLGRRKHQGGPTWKRHLHINGTIYYSLETQDSSRLFRRIITAEDVTDPDIQTAIEECGDEYHEWLEEADLEDLPYDLELLVHFDNPYRRETIGSFMSYQKEVKFTCCPRDDSNSESGYASSSSVPTSCRIGFRSHYFTLGLLTFPRSLRYSRNNLSGSR
jgi:hypothetical protein